MDLRRTFAAAGASSATAQHARSLFGCKRVPLPRKGYAQAAGPCAGGQRRSQLGKGGGVRGGSRLMAVPVPAVPGWSPACVCRTARQRCCTSLLYKSVIPPRIRFAACRRCAHLTPLPGHLTGPRAERLPPASRALQ